MKREYGEIDYCDAMVEQAEKNKTERNANKLERLQDRMQELMCGISNANELISKHKFDIKKVREDLDEMERELRKLQTIQETLDAL